jgi:signal transduction histidine kinase
MFEQESKIYIGVLVAAVVLILMITAFLLLAVRYHHSRKKLYIQQVAAEITGIEKDRKRIAADLHDEIGSLLTYVKLKLSNMVVDESSGSDLATVRQKLDYMHDSLLAITNDLLPNSLEQNGLLHTLEEFLDEAGSRPGIHVNYAAAPQIEQYIHSTIKIHIYRIVTELVQNSIKHAGATAITLSFARGKQELLMHYNDNGKGFDIKKELRNNKGLGLKNIRSRVHLFKGTLYLDSSPGNGVHYTIQIPLNATTH